MLNPTIAPHSVAYLRHAEIAANVVDPRDWKQDFDAVNGGVAVHNERESASINRTTPLQIDGLSGWTKPTWMGISSPLAKKSPHAGRELWTDSDICTRTSLPSRRY